MAAHTRDSRLRSEASQGMPSRASRSEFVDVRGTRIHVRRWGSPNAPMLFMFHGWMDMSATFQFVVDAMQQDWNIIAPDWTGFGLSAPRGGDYLTAGYVADMDRLVEHYSPGARARLVAHSMGAQVATLYCGIRPERVAGLVNLDGLAPLPPLGAEAELQRLDRWVKYAVETRVTRTYDSRDDFAAELSVRNPRLSSDKAEFLAGCFTRMLDDGRAELLADPHHYRIGGVPRFSAEAMDVALSKFVGAVLWILGSESPQGRAFSRLSNGDEVLSARFAAARYGQQVTLTQAGHNVQHDRPAEVASLVEEFFQLGTSGAPTVTRVRNTLHL